MIYQYKFEKILTIKEKEKRDALSKYNAALKTFEEVAEKLYKLLKKKEDLLEFQQEKLLSHCQQEVIEARYKMNVLQEVLLERNIEVKKYEKMKENEFLKFLDVIKEAENKQMDEISIRQFFSKGR